MQHTLTFAIVEAEEAKQAEDTESAVGIARLTKVNLVQMTDDEAMEIGGPLLTDTPLQPVTDTAIQTKPVQGFIKGRSSLNTVDKSGTPRTDFYETPEKVTKRLFETYFRFIPAYSTVYCPCDGSGALSNVLEKLSDEMGLHWVFIRRDIRGEPNEDYLKAPSYDYFITIENIPW
jgi:hypothetical protein